MSGDVLITGAQGFVGRALSAELLAQGYTVRSWTRQQGDIATAELPAGAAHVIHLAAKTYVPESWTNPAEFFRVNVQGTVNVLEHCRRTGASLILLSSYVYGKPQHLPIDEEHPLAAFNPYGQSKLLAEDAALSYARFFRVPVTIIRPFNIYGPGQGSQFLIPTLVEQMLDPAREQIEVMDARPRRDYLFLTDFVELVLAVLRRPEQAGIYNAGSGRSCSIEELTGHLNAITGQQKPLRSTGQPRPDEVLDVVAGIERARRKLDWHPRVTIEEGLRRVVAGARESA